MGDDNTPKLKSSFLRLIDSANDCPYAYTHRRQLLENEHVTYAQQEVDNTIA